MNCPSCQSETPDGSKFCGECGTKLPSGCATCGTQNAPTAKFCAECGTKLDRVAATTLLQAPAPTPAVAAQTSNAERRHITVMFCDMVGSSQLSTVLDPERNRDVVGAFLSCAATEVTNLDGMVAAYLGDGILAYFGYPTAHEDDAERAIRAGLSIIEAIGTLELGLDHRLQTRIGLASGVVVVGDLVAKGVAQQNAAIGETTNLAARLQALAEPDTLVIEESTFELVGGQFEYRDLGRQQVKGFGTPVQTLQVLGLSEEESRFAARTKEGMSPVFGRDEEMEIIDRRWQNAVGGEGRVVLVTGEAGIGKSRIGRALEELLANEEYRLMTFHCSPYHRDSALHPVIGQIMRVIGLSRQDSTAEKLAKLRTNLADVGENLSENVALYASLLSIPLDGPSPLDDLSPQELKTKTLNALMVTLQTLCAQRPVLLLFEDLHWIDATSLELLSLIVQRAPTLRLLVMATTRPGFNAPWPRYSHVSFVALNRLANREARALVLSVTDGKVLAPELVEQIIERADGIPLFVEELTKSVLENELLTFEGGTYSMAGAAASVAIPPTLHASLIARLDRLSSAKDVAQIGSAIGRQFSHALLSAVTKATSPVLKDALDRLIDAELIFERSVGLDTIYEFKHALFHDATYASLIAGRRQQLHARIATALETDFPEDVDSEPETLARHFNEAGLTERAVALWRQAGERAVSRCENTEALALLRTALTNLERLDDTPARAQQEFSLQIALGAALMIVEGQSKPEVEQAYSRARALADFAGESDEAYTALIGMWRYYAARGDQEEARDAAELLQALAERLGTKELCIKANMALGITLYQQWENPARAIDLLSEATELYESDPPDEQDVAMTALGSHPGFMCAMGVALTHWLLGKTYQCHEWRDRSLAIGARLNNPFQGVIVHGWNAVLAYNLQDWDRLRVEIAASNALATKHQVPVWIAITEIFGGFLKVIDGNIEGGLASCVAAVDELDALGYGTFRTRSLMIRARAYDYAKQPQQGLASIDEAIDGYGNQREVWIQPELHRIRGELLMQFGAERAEEALEALGTAIDTADRLCVPTYFRRSGLSLARAQAKLVDVATAQVTLQRVMADWVEDPLSEDWKEAQSLVQELR
jgi:class 3 adenylate cyclase/tetratricopeptide (TPR) repeat protein